MKVKCILHVDNEYIFHLGMKEYFSSNDKSIDFRYADSSRTASKLLKDLQPELIITNINAAHHEEFLQTISLIETKSSIPFAVLSSHSDEFTVMQALRAGAKSYLTKDIETDDLKNLLTAVENKQQFFSSRVSGIAKQFLRNRSTRKKNSLSKTELKVLKLVCEEYPSKQIADMMHIETHTVDNHRTHLYQKTKTHNIAGLVKFGLLYYNFLLLLTAIPLTFLQELSDWSIAEMIF